MPYLGILHQSYALLIIKALKLGVNVDENNRQEWVSSYLSKFLFRLTGFWRHYASFSENKLVNFEQAENKNTTWEHGSI